MSNEIKLSAGQQFFRKCFGYINVSDWRIKGLSEFECTHSIVNNNRKPYVWKYIKSGPYFQETNDFDKVPLYIPPKPVPLPVVNITKWEAYKKRGKICVVCPTCEYINCHVLNVTRHDLLRSAISGYCDCSRIGCFGYNYIIS